MDPGAAAATQDRIAISEIRGPDAEKQFSALLDASFGLPPGAHFLEDFPVWDERFGPGAPTAARLGAFDGRKLVSSACVRLAVMQMPASGGAAARYPVALIGAVTTDPAYRGRGLASRAVEAALRWAEARKAAAALLWGSEHALYRRLGFELCGAQQGIPLASLELPAALPRARVRNGWAPGIFALQRARGSGIALGESDLRWMREHRHVEWFWTGHPDSPAAYVALGRGIDLQGYVHEWGGAPAEVRALLAAVRASFPEAMLLGGPEVLRPLGIPAEKAPRDYLCMAKVLDPVAIFAARHGVTIETSLDGGFWRLRGPDFGFEGLNSSDLSRLFFGPDSVTASSPAARWFPIPLWVWGLDAV